MERIRLSRTVFPLLIGVFTLLAILYNPDPAHDLYRYYQEAERLNMNDGLFAVIDNYYSLEAAFLYYVSFYFVRLVGLPIHLVNGFYVFLIYYSSSLLILDVAKMMKKVSVREINIALLFMFCSTPFNFIFSISRTTAALAFLYLSIHCLINKKYILLIIFAALAVMTHIGILLYIAIFSISYFIMWILQRTKHNRVTPLIAILLGAFLFFMLSYGLNLILQLSFFDAYHYYARYIEDVGLVSLSDAQLGTIATVTLVWIVFVIFALAFITKLQYPFNFILLLVPFLFISFFMKNMFVQRTLMFMLPFNGILLIGTKGRLNIGTQSIITTVSVFLNCSILVSITRCFL